MMEMIGNQNDRRNVRSMSLNLFLLLLNPHVSMCCEWRKPLIPRSYSLDVCMLKAKNLNDKNFLETFIMTNYLIQFANVIFYR